MPEGFGYPEYERIWTPLRTDGSRVAPGTIPKVSVSGQLAPGVSREEAQAELGAIGARLAAAIFSRAILKIGVGILLGSVLATLIGVGPDTGFVLMIGTNALMLVVGLTACAVRLRRALRIEPTQALRAEG